MEYFDKCWITDAEDLLREIHFMSVWSVGVPHSTTDTNQSDNEALDAGGKFKMLQSHLGPGSMLRLLQRVGNYWLQI